MPSTTSGAPCGLQAAATGLTQLRLPSRPQVPVSGTGVKWLELLVSAVLGDRETQTPAADPSVATLMSTCILPGRGEPLTSSGINSQHSTYTLNV